MATHKHESGLEADTSLTDISKVIEKLPASGIRKLSS